MNSDNQVAERLQELSHFLQEKDRRLRALLQLFSANPTLPIEGMVREYSGVLDATDGQVYLEQVRGDAGAEGLNSRQRAARTKRIRTRDRLVSAAEQAVVLGQTSGSYFFERVAAISGLSVATIFNHFATKNELLWAAYDRLLQPDCNPTVKGN